MSKWLNVLAKAGLVELDPGERSRVAAEEELQEEDLDAVLAESRALIDAVGGTRQPVVFEPEPESVVEPLVAVREGVPLLELYAELGVDPSPLPVEKLLKILDGLKAMDPSIRKAAVLAMDAAEERWTLGDALLDARRKTDALLQASKRLAAIAATAETQAQADLAAQDEYKTQASDHIRRQILDLEALLEKELQGVATEKVSINARLQETRSACSREAARYEAEIDRMKSLNLTFPAES